MSGIMEGRVAFVTGGGSGMGRETARLLAEAEARVAVADLNEDGARETAAAIEAAGGRAWATKLDVSDSAAVDAAVSAAAEALGPIDALVNIAGIYQCRLRRAPRRDGEASWDSCGGGQGRGWAFIAKQ